MKSIPEDNRSFPHAPQIDRAMRARMLVMATCLMALSGCKAQTPSPEDLASHEASMKAAAVCEAIKDEDRRRECWHDVPVDWTDADPNEIVGVSLTGIDHLADHLSVQEFFVDGAPGAQAGKGGSTMCCAKLPNRWRNDLTVEVRWFVQNWRDCIYEEHEARVPVEPYTEADHTYVHFLASGNVRVVATSWYPEKANLPGSKYPVKDPIPDKAPWHVYPAAGCDGKWVERKAREVDETRRKSEP